MHLLLTVYKSYENITNAASAAWNHVTNCAEVNLQIKGDGPTFPEGSMACMDAMSVIEAKMTKLGGLDFETNIEWLLTSLVEVAIGSRVDFFQVPTCGTIVCLERRPTRSSME